MMRRARALLAAAALATLAASPAAVAQPAPPVPAGGARLAIVGGELWQPDAEPVKDSVVVIVDGVVRYVGTDRAQAAGAELVDATGQVVTAGFVDPLTQIGLLEIDLEASTRDTSAADPDPVRAAFRAADAYTPLTDLVPIARREGLTPVGVVPTGGLVSGQSAWADLDGNEAARALAVPSLALHVLLDDATHETVRESHASSLLRLRELLDDARLYRQKR
ncbi:MAG: hypothetical protein IT373_33520, partial [Polyangiaceae bacterium]|nr:hypothetical protein [Polyangiaceae bacterium]